MSGANLIQFSVACWVLFGSASALIFTLIILFRTLNMVEAELWRIKTFREWAEAERDNTTRETE